jgi:hypothetical protein
MEGKGKGQGKEVMMGNGFDFFFSLFLFRVLAFDPFGFFPLKFWDFYFFSLDSILDYFLFSSMDRLSSKRDFWVDNNYASFFLTL